MTSATPTYSIRQPLAVMSWFWQVAPKNYGRVPKWTKGTDCKSVIRRFESGLGLLPPGAAIESREEKVESRAREAITPDLLSTLYPLLSRRGWPRRAAIAQLAEHRFCKPAVTSSTLVRGFRQILRHPPPVSLLAQTTSPQDTTQPAILAQETKGTPDARADQLIAEMTQTEKIQLLSGGQGGYATRALPRLGINAFVTTDGPNGVRNGPGNPTPRACAFPCGAALAATWDPELAAAYGKAIGLENRARGSNFQLGPGLNICRVPVNGRNFEYFGEDPYLASIVAVNWVKACAATGASAKRPACRSSSTLPAIIRRPTAILSTPRSMSGR